MIEQKPRVKKFTLRLEVGLIKEVRLIALQNDMSATKAVTEALREYVATRRKTSQKKAMEVVAR